MTSKSEWHRARAAELHDQGAEKFGAAWLTANDLTSTAGYDADIEEYNPREVHILSCVAYAICDKLLASPTPPTGAASGGEGTGR